MRTATRRTSAPPSLALANAFYHLYAAARGDTSWSAVPARMSTGALTAASERGAMRSRVMYAHTCDRSRAERPGPSSDRCMCQRV